MENYYNKNQWTAEQLLQALRELEAELQELKAVYNDGEDVGDQINDCCVEIGAIMQAQEALV